MLQIRKSYSSHFGGGGEGRRRWMNPTIALLALFILTYVCYSTFSSGDYLWLCSHCNSNHIALQLTAAENPVAAEAAAVAAPPSPSPTNLSHIVFGIGASTRTWSQRRGYSELWWRPGATRGHVWLEEKPPKGTWPATSPPFRVSADEFRFGERADAARMARIVAEEYQLATAAARAGGGREEEVWWFVMGDDDTVFFVENLVAVLGKYDHEEMYYIGAASESVEQDLVHAYGMAFGGGGFAVSAPAAAELVRVMDGCLERYASFYGSDQRVQSCMSELGVPLTRELGFHQVDLRGDAYGMLAAHPVAPLVSLHHLDHLEPIAPSTGGDRLAALRSLFNASRFDPSRILQQCFCYDTQKGSTWSISVSWGYTVQIYPWVVEPRELEVPLQTFQTWRSSSDGPFTFNTRPFPADRPCERPLLYFLDWVMEGQKNQDGLSNTVSEYSRLKFENERCNSPSFEAALEVDRIRVFAPKLDPAVWRRAPRRQCCQTSRAISNSTMEVWIRNCNPGEVTRPPRR